MAYRINFIKWLLYHEESEHMRRIYSPIFWKAVDPVAINPLFEKREDKRGYYVFGGKSRYVMVR